MSLPRIHCNTLLALSVVILFVVAIVAGNAFVTVAALGIVFFFLFLVVDIVGNILLNLLCLHPFRSFDNHWRLHVLSLLLSILFQVA